MAPITAVTGRGLPLRGDELDTDRIMPARFLRAVTFEGLERHVFEDDRKANAQHPFNNPKYQGASILLVNSNFGCGSSREHAPWALGDYGFRAVIAPSFADIFRANAIGNGMLPVALPETAVDVILDRSEREQNYSVEVDLERCQVRDSFGLQEPFTIDSASRQRLLEGKDEIDLILTHESDIAAYEQRVPTL